MAELVTITEIRQEKSRILLPTKLYVPPREGPSYQQIYQPQIHDLTAALQSAADSPLLAIDFETRGDDYSLEYKPISDSNPDTELAALTTTEIVGIGLAWDGGSIYFDWRNLDSASRLKLLSILQRHPALVAHNVYFDGGYLYQLLGSHGNWATCTYALLAMLANEGYPGEGWGLKMAMVEYLGWEDTNETDLDLWLVTNGYYKGTRRLDNSIEYLTGEYWKRRETGSGGLAAEKGEMWRAPSDILGKYCVLDAEASYLLATKVLLPVMEKFPGLVEYYSQELMPHIMGHIDQKFRGIEIDSTKLHSRHKFVVNEMQHLYSTFREHPQVAGHIREIEARLAAEQLSAEPAKFNICKVRDPGPVQYTKAGLVNATWQKNHDKFVAHKCDPECISKTWLNWTVRRDSLQTEGELAPKFNIDSDPQMIELLYDRLGYPVEITSEKTGQPSTATKAYSKMGELGSILIDRQYLLKERGYLTKYQELIKHRPTIHPSFRIPGTKTGRPSSKDPNILQVSKTKSMLSIFRSRPGFVFVDLDFNAVENVVAAEFSEDANLRFLYEDPSKINDIHLYVAANIPGELGKKVRATGYDPLHPTPYTVSQAKKLVKRERSIIKTAVYLMQYFGGVNRLNSSLEEDDIFLPFDLVQQIYNTYWGTFPGLREFQNKLIYEWKQNGGYILNGFGRPMALVETGRGETKDLSSRFYQSTALELLVKYSNLVCKTLDSAGVEWYPSILNFYDAITVEVREEDAEQTTSIFSANLIELNNKVGGDLQIRGTPVVGKTLADVKDPEEE